MKRLTFAKSGWTIELQGCDDIAAQTHDIFHGWKLKLAEVTASQPDSLRARINRKANGWTWRSYNRAPKPRDWDKVPPRTAIRVLTDIHDAALYWYLFEHPSLLCLHGAAVQIGSTLVCFPAKGFAGKSTLVAALATLGHKVFADDVLGLSGKACTGYAMGFSPRLRTPLPATLPGSLHQFVETNHGPRGPGWIYLNLPAAQQAQLGERHSVGAIVMLERAPDEPADLRETNQVSVLRNLIAENIIRQIPMMEIFKRLERLARTTPRFVLRYDDPFHAAALLTERFA